MNGKNGYVFYVDTTGAFPTIVHDNLNGAKFRVYKRNETHLRDDLYPHNSPYAILSCEQSRGNHFDGLIPDEVKTFVTSVISAWTQLYVEKIINARTLDEAKDLHAYYYNKLGEHVSFSLARAFPPSQTQKDRAKQIIEAHEEYTKAMRKLDL